MSSREGEVLNLEAEESVEQRKDLTEATGVRVESQTTRPQGCLILWRGRLFDVEGFKVGPDCNTGLSHTAEEQLTWEFLP